MWSFNQIEKFMLDHMPSSDPVHGPEHIYRVLTTAMDIAAHCGQSGEQNILLAACLLHDIGRIDQTQYPQLTHAQIGSQKAYSFLLSIGWEDTYARRVSDAILTHSQYQDQQSISAEAQILFDADKLDTIGFIGMARLLMHTGEQGAPLYCLGRQELLCPGSKHKETSFLQEYQAAESIAKKLYTVYARKVASERLQKTKAFYNGLIGDITHYHDQLQIIRTAFFD